MKVKLWADVNFAGCKQTEVIEVDADTTDEVLEEEAKGFLENTIQPEYGFERLDESHNDHDCEDEGCGDD